MVTIVQGIRRPNPIAEGINNAAKAIFGDQLTPALKRSQLNLAEQKFARENAEAIGLDNLARSFDPGGNVSGRLSDAVRSGFSASDLGRLGLQEAAQGFSGDLSDASALPLSRAQLGAGLATSSTIPGFNASEAQDAALTREGIASTAATSRANQAARIGEQRFQFENAPLTESEQRAVFLKQQFDSLTPLQQRAVLDAAPSQTEVQGSLLEQNFPNLDTLGPRQAEVLGALPSESNVRGDVLSRALEGVDPTTIPEANVLEAAGLGAPAPVAVRRFQTQDGRAFRSTDNGLSDLDTGESIPADAVEIGKLSAASREDAGLLSPTASNATAVFGEATALRNFQDTVSVARSIAQNDPTIFGPAGFIRSIGQGAAQGAQSLDALFGGDGGFEAQVTDAQRQLLDESTEPGARASLSGLFDPNLDAITKITTLLVFQGASALAGQEGRGLSDKDVKLFQDIFGNPQSLFSSQATFLNSLNLADDIVERRLQSNRERQQGQFNAAPTVVPEITIDAEGNIVQ